MKKLIFIILLAFTIFIFALCYAVNEQGKEYSKIGTTTNDYVAIDPIYPLRFSEVSILIKNTGSSTNDLSFAVKGYLTQNSTAYITFASGTNIADGDDVICHLNNAYAKVIVEVKATIADSITTYSIDSLMRY